MQVHEAVMTAGSEPESMSETHRNPMQAVIWKSRLGRKGLYLRHLKSRTSTGPFGRADRRCSPRSHGSAGLSVGSKVGRC